VARSRFDLDGKVALVTGGNGGIGLGMARGLAEHGADVVIWGTNPAKTAAAEADLKVLGGRVFAQLVDVSDKATVEAATAEALARMGRLDCVIANAALGGVFTPFTEVTMEEYGRTVAVNLGGVFWTLQAACRHMIERAEAGDPGGSLVAVSSIGAFKSYSGVEPYVAAKGALLSLTRSLAVGHGRYGIRANCIIPGFVATEMTQGLRDDPAMAQASLARIPAARWGEPDDLAGIAVYLASDASRYHTGDSLAVDGGYLA